MLMSLDSFIGLMLFFVFSQRFLMMVDFDFSSCEIAYFTMEIGIKKDMPTYAGGLGVLGGDTMRSAADLELPFICITLVHRKGYYRQELVDGSQEDRPEGWDPSQHLEKLDDVVEIEIEGRNVRIAGWVYLFEGVTGHKVPVVFLDTDMDGNSDYDRQLTHHLYGKDDKYRLAQEMVLGIGGVKMLESLKCGIRKYHMNEGHSALLALALCGRCLAEGEDDVLQAVRKRCVFTTHTPVPAGHDKFPKELALKMLGSYAHDEMRDVLFRDGVLNMTYVGLELSDCVNGVSRKHTEVSTEMFPGHNIYSITNGVHAVFWTSGPFRDLFDEYVSVWRVDPFNLRTVFSIPDRRIWDAHQESKKALIDFVNSEYDAGMDVDAFTIGFARRVAPYKRANLIFTDPERLKRIGERGLQLIFSGKPHPGDTKGRELLEEIFRNFRKVSDVIRVVYIEDYDIDVAKMMVSGVDLWLNTPMRPKEASGTSGIKAAFNGVPQFSILDGWWLEGHIEGVTGWSIGAHPEKKEKSEHEEDVEDMYSKLQEVILPRFYDGRDSWIQMMKMTIAVNGSFFNSHRMLQEYVLNAYSR